MRRYRHLQPSCGVTVRLPRELVEAMAARGSNRSRIIAQAVRAYLATTPPLPIEPPRKPARGAVYCPVHGYECGAQYAGEDVKCGQSGVVYVALE